MKSQLPLSSDEDEDYGRLSAASGAAYCWWRSTAAFDEYCMNENKQLPSITGLTRQVRLLRELERLALVVAGDGLDELRQKLFAYRVGDFWIPAGGIPREEMDIPAANTVLLTGFTGSGKSSLVNLMYSVLGRAGLIPFAQTSSGKSSENTTMFLQEHNVLRSVRSGFCVYDSRGFNYDNVSEGLDELSGWMSEGVHHNQPCVRPGDQGPAEEDSESFMSTSSSKYVVRRVNCVLVIVNIAEVYQAMKGGDLKPLMATKELFCFPPLRVCGEYPILITTHGDMLLPKERLEARLKITEILGISEATGMYDIVCLTEYGFLAEESDPVTAFALAETVYRALLISDRTHVPRRSPRDWALMVISWLLCFFGAIFSLLAEFCSKLGRRRCFRI
ncbi:uncharacterized protein LOC116187534 [Punica granatum]|uniref:G domain-containing protein n=2 Tax=Punica granatum TaxID=22663 RepID=A0A218X588_PUNGR|nr:uncharacterized protein LOC116187534 [Punica granatum]OWM80083.1 hypothetical protein CDL15_Pgr010061 [Punica granatum]PKI73937.1 hypothetical protein CRG98_005662 [Punica granatum]